MIELIGKNKAKLIVSVGSGKNRKRHSKIVSFNKKSELKELHRAFEDEWKMNPLADISIRGLVENYIKSRKSIGIAETTLQGYESTAERIYSVLDEQRATEVTSYQLQNFVSALSEKYKPKTVRNTVSLLSSSYDSAIRLGQIAKNPCRMIELPKNEKKDIDIFSRDDISVFLKELATERLDYIVGYELALFCGMRRSEILGLKEQDINIPFKCVSINKSRHRIKGQDIVKTTKTESSKRTLAVPDFVIADIEKLIAEHHSKEYEVSDYLIQDGFGKMLTPAALTQRIYYIEERAGLPSVSLHDLRHTFASMLNSANVDIAMISRELGHSNISTTLNIYTHVFGNVTEASRSIADNLNSQFSAPNLPPTEERKTANA